MGTQHSPNANVSRPRRNTTQSSDSGPRVEEESLSVCQDEGVPSYWLVDPYLDKPSLTVLELVDGRYQEVARLTGDERWTAAKPFSVEVCPADLVAELRG